GYWFLPRKAPCLLGPLASENSWACSPRRLGGVPGRPRTTPSLKRRCGCCPISFQFGRVGSESQRSTLIWGRPDQTAEGCMVHRALALWLLLLGFGTAAGADGPVVIGETRRIHSTVLNEDRVYRVSLPESYGWAKDRRYPVLFLLDGQTHFLHVAGSVGYLAQQGDIPEMIVVGLDSTVRIRDFTQTDWPSVWVGGGGAGNFKRFISTELIPDVDK